MIDNKQIIKKDTMLVKDDFFDDIVNGLKSPIEENVDKSKSDKSEIDFGGQQKNRFNKVIVPEMYPAFKQGTLIQDYVDETKKQYEKLKIQEIKEYIEETQLGLEELEDVQEEAEDELEELKDGGGFFNSLFFKVVKAGYKVFKMVTFFLRFYGYYARVKGIFDKSKIQMSDQQHGFNIGDYDIMNNEIDRERAAMQFTKYLNTTVLDRFRAFLSPILYEITKAIYGATDMVFAWVNRKIYIWIAKQVAYFLWEIALTVALNAVAAALTASGVGAAAGIALFATTAIRIANLTRKISKFAKTAKGAYKILSGGRKVVKALNKGRKALDALRKSKRLQKGGQKAIDFLKKAKKIDPKKRKKIIDTTADVAEAAYKADEVASGLVEIFDTLTITKEELLEKRAQFRNVGAKVGQSIINGLDRIQNFFETANKRSNVSGFSANLMASMSDKYGVNIMGVENTGLDINSIGETIDKLDTKIDGIEIDVPKPKIKNNLITFDQMEIDLKKGTFKYKDFVLDKEVNKNTLDILKTMNVIKDHSVVLAQDGKEIRYQNGSMSAVQLKFVSQGYIRKVIVNNPNKNAVNVINSFTRMEFDENGNVKGPELPTNLELGLEKVPEADVLSIKGLKQRQKFLPDEPVLIKDLSDIVIPRNTWLKREKSILTKVRSWADSFQVIA